MLGEGNETGRFRLSRRREASKGRVASPRSCVSSAASPLERNVPFGLSKSSSSETGGDGSETRCSLDGNERMMKGIIGVSVLC